MTPRLTLEYFDGNITNEELNQMTLDFLRNVTSQLTFQQKHQINDPVNNPSFFYNMMQQQRQNIATPRRQFIPKKVLK